MLCATGRILFIPRDPSFSDWNFRFTTVPWKDQGTNARKINCSRVYSAYILKPVLSGRNFLTRIDASVFVWYPRKTKAFDFDNFENSHNSFLWPEYFIVYFCENWFYVRLWHPSCVYLSAQREYIAVQKMRAPLK